MLGLMISSKAKIIFFIILLRHWGFSTQFCAMVLFSNAPHPSFAQSPLTLCNLLDCSPPGSFVHGIY